jgi:hypothetical protein
MIVGVSMFKGVMRTPLTKFPVYCLFSHWEHVQAVS